MLRRLRRRVAERLALRRRGAAAAPRLPREHERSADRAQDRAQDRARQRDIDELLHLARLSFVQLQAAWDRADLGALRSLATDSLLEELSSQLAERGPGPNHTEVLSLDARLLNLEELHEAFVASVEFSGVIREQSDAGAAPFRELWLLAKLKSTGQGWQLARVQSLS